MCDVSEQAKRWSDREFAKKFVDDLQEDDRITDCKDGTYILYRPSASTQPIFESGDCDAVKEAIDLGWLKTIDGTTYRKRIESMR